MECEEEGLLCVYDNSKQKNEDTIRREWPKESYDTEESVQEFSGMSLQIVSHYCSVCKPIIQNANQ